MQIKSKIIIEKGSTFMRILEFEVNKQVIKRKPGCDFSNIVAGSVGYLHAKFYFSKEWNDCTKAASFIANNNLYPVLLDDNNMCIIPKEVLGGKFFEVAVKGARIPDYVIDTSRIKIRQEVY